MRCLNSHLSIAIAVLFNACKPAEISRQRLELSEKIEQSARMELLDVWYPMAVDSAHGGFLSNFTYEFKPTAEQNKMIVSQSRHVWTTAKAAMTYPENGEYLRASAHGARFLIDVMWDKTYGGFYQLVDRQGNVLPSTDAQKTAYGNAFAIYGLSAYAMASGDTTALELAKKAFMWLEKHSHDPVHKGYFQHLNRNGSVIIRSPEEPTTSDLGYKDQNSSIHLLEAFTELYQIWPDPMVEERLKEMLYLIRDTITTDEGYLTLFFLPDWTPISYHDSTEQVITKHHHLDHVSFGHDVETAYLMIEASHVAGIQNDSLTLNIAKRMVDHALKNGWDSVAGGFYDEGYYFRDSPDITITRATKNWWAQAEGLNTLLMMADLFPNDQMRYYEKFRRMWDYIDRYLIDHKHGEWYSGGLDKQPELRTALKGHIWKACYHQYRSLENCVRRLRQEDPNH